MKVLTIVVGLLGGVCFVVAIILFILAFAVGVPHHTSASFTFPASIILVAAAPFGAAATWAANRRDQALAMRSSRTVEPVNLAERQSLAVPMGRLDSHFLKSIRGPLICCVLLIALTICLVVLAFTQTAAASPFLTSAAGVCTAICLSWGILWDPLYVRPLDISQLGADRPHAKIWLSSTTVGLSSFASLFGSRSVPGPRLRAIGYIVVDPESVEFWQRKDGQLVQVLAIPRSFIAGVTTDSVPLAFTNQQGITMTVSGPIIPPVELPLIPMNPRRMIAGRGADEFERFYNSRP
jgi:hypothetical protein